MATINLEDKIINYEYEYRRVKNHRLEFRPQGLKVILPLGSLRSPEDIISGHRRWVYRNALLFEAVHRSFADLPLNRGISREEFLEGAYKLADEYAEELKVTVKKVRLRSMRARWGSCDCRDTITLNSKLRFLPGQCVRYVAYHEVLHMRYRGHGKRFRDRLRKKFPDYKKIDGLLFSYDMLLKQDLKPEDLT